MKLSVVLVFICIFSYKTIHCFETSGHQYEQSDQSGSSTSDQEVDKIEQCSENEIIEEMLDIFTPEDFDEGKDNIKTELESFNETLKAINRLQEYSRNVSQKMSEFTKRLNSRISEGLMTIDLPQDCLASLTRIMGAAKNGEIWALRFFEAQPKPNNGMLELTGPGYGNFDQCLSIESPDEADKPKIFGQYCGVALEPYVIYDQKQYPRDLFQTTDEDSPGKRLLSQLFSNTMKVQKRRTHEEMMTVIGFMEAFIYAPTKIINGLCLPTTCNPNDVSKAINDLTYPMSRIPFNISDDCYYERKPVTLNKYQIISIVGLSSVFLVFLLSSIVDSLPKTSVISKSLEKTALVFYIKCFSIKRNFDSVFGLKQYGKFKALDGFRAILTFYVVVLHTYEFGLIYHINKNHYLSAAYAMILDYRNMFLPNILLMDNFMLVSGFLLGNTMLSKLGQSKGKFNYVNYLIYRYLRVLPILLTGLFMTYLFALIGDGPFWEMITMYFIDPCYDRWYKVLTMVNNVLYYRTEESTVKASVQCMTITWYASCDFQLYALAPIAFLLLYKLPKYGVFLNMGLLLFSILLPVFNKVVMDYPHVFEIVSDPNYQRVMEGWVVHYWGPINYMQTYIIGILLAYLVRHKPNIYLGGRIGEALIWITTVFSSLSLLYWQRNFILPGYEFEGIGGFEIHVYMIFHKLLYLSGFAWMLFACVTGRGGYLNKMLGWKGFKVVDNLTLEIYIMHTFLFIYRMGVRRDQVTYTDYYVWTSAIFDFVGSYILSVIVALVVTRPFAKMAMALLKPPQKKPKVVSEEINEELKPNDQTLNENISIINEKESKDSTVVLKSIERTRL